MITFCLTILIIYLVWLLVKPMLVSYMHRRYTERINDMFGQAFGGQGFGRQQQRQQSSHDGYGYRARRKIFSRDEGEYVDFEEIDVKVEYSAESNDTHQYSPREPQVSDAEWEDIKE